VDDSPAPWLRVTDMKSLTDESLPLEVTIEATGMGDADKHYSCKLEVRLENEQTHSKDIAIVKIQLWMKPDPGVLKVYVDAINFKFVKTGSSKSKIFQIRNSGHGHLQGRVVTTRRWLSISPNSVNLAASKRCTYKVTLNSEAMKQGFTDKAFINIVTNGGNQRIPVELSVVPFSFSQISSFLLYVFAGLLVISSPVIFSPGNLPIDYQHEPLFWTILGVYVIIIGSAIIRLLLNGKRLLQSVETKFVNMIFKLRTRKNDLR
jgi:hypothetical protein